MHKLGTRIEVLATVEQELKIKNSTRFVQRCFASNDGETHKMAFGELANMFVEITPSRVEVEPIDSSVIANNTRINLNTLQNTRLRPSAGVETTMNTSG